VTARALLGLLGFGLVGLAAPAAHADEVVPLVSGGPIANRLNVAILGDGYTSSVADQAKLDSDARGVLAGLLSFGPYQAYKGLFNVKLIHTISPTSNIPKNGRPGNTAVGCYYGCGGIDRLVCCDSGSEGFVVEATAANVPEATLSIVVVNDSTYGGSGGGYTVVSTNSAAIDILRHELGHTLAGLADEYTSPYPGYGMCDPASDCPEPNATLFPQRPGKWGQWLTPDICVPTPPGTEGVGYFEGCRYQTAGVFRPVSNPSCLMNALGNSFCPVCAEAVSLSLWSHARAVDTATPDTAAPVVTAGCAQQSFAITLVANAGQLAVSWSIDGVPQSNATTTTATFDTNFLTPGPHQVVAAVHDNNSAIRVDVNHLTTTTTTWIWQTSCSTGVTPDAGVVVPPDAAVDAASGQPGNCHVNETADAGNGGGGGTPGGGGCIAAPGGGFGSAGIAAMFGLTPLVRRRRRARRLHS
jgi:IgA peptidase M64